MKFIIKIFRYILNHGNRKRIKHYARIHSSVKDIGIKIRLDKPVDNIYLTIGENSIVKGDFIFESESGQVCIGTHSYIGGSTFISRSKIEVGDNVTIAWGCTIYDHDSHSLNYLNRRKDIDDELNDLQNGRSMVANKDWSCVNTKPIIICNDVWIGMNCIILKGVTIGQGAVVGAGSVITKDVPEWSVVAGNPARVVKKLK
jgi:galactoside O-acetyltransferase